MRYADQLLDLYERAPDVVMLGESIDQIAAAAHAAVMSEMFERVTAHDHQMRMLACALMLYALGANFPGPPPNAMPGELARLRRAFWDAVSALVQ